MATKRMPPRPDRLPGKIKYRPPKGAEIARPLAKPGKRRIRKK